MGTVRRPDRVLAAQLYQHGISVGVIENAFVLAATRRLIRPADAPLWARFVRWLIPFGAHNALRSTSNRGQPESKGVR
jgi:hypothetical protein